MSIIPWKFDMVPLHRRSGNGSPLGMLQEEINQLFDDIFGEQTAGHRMPGYFPAEKMWAPALDVVENDKGFSVHAELPGMDASNVALEVTDSTLTLKGEKKGHKEESDGSYVRRETSYGSFRRTIALPETADLDKAKAEFKNGVLTLSVPKKAQSEKPTKTIKIQPAA